ncbi:MAG: tetratricopeptide repeat protein [Bacteroidia bacterium]
MKRLSFLILFSLSFSLVIAQVPDSIRAIYMNTTLADSIRLNALDKIAFGLRDNAPDTAIMLAELEKRMAEKSGLKKYRANAFKVLGSCYNSKGNYDQAFGNYKLALDIFTELADKKGIASCYVNMGTVYEHQSKYPKALEFYLKGLKIFEETGNKYAAGVTYSNIGNIYQYLSNYPKALEFQLKALHTGEEVGDAYGISTGYTNIGGLYYLQDENLKAKEYLLKALAMKEKLGDSQGIITCYSNLALVYERLSDPKEALDHYFKALQILKELGDKRGLSSDYLNIAIYYTKLKNYKMAELYNDSALRISSEIRDLNVQRISYQNLASIYRLTGRYKEAYESYVLFKQFNDSIYNIENSKYLGDMKTRYEVEKKETELKIKAEAQQAINLQERKKQQFVIYAVAGVLILVVVFSLFLFNRFRITQTQKKIIEKQKVMVDKAFGELHEKNKEVMDSIYYARRIQNALITSEKYINNQLKRLAGQRKD